MKILNLSNYRTFAIHTLGCKVNLYESEAIANQLRMVGLIQIDFDQIADIYVINTCSVTNAADAKSRNIIARASKKNPQAIIVVAGCYSQLASDVLIEKYKVDIIIGNKYKNQIVELIEKFLKSSKQIRQIDNLLIEKNFENFDLQDFENHTRAFIKIQDGCNFMCSYCTIPFTRGRQRSAPLNELLDNISNLVKKGYKEIVLTGVNTAGYLDQDKNNFYDLLEALKELNGNFRVRISSVEPFQITDEIIQIITNNPQRFCGHWHICLQSGSDNVLNSMNRKYTNADFALLLEKIRNKDSRASISTDIIVGYPNETNSNYEESYEFIKNHKFSFLHVFPYSKRSNTKAASMIQIDEKNKKLRTQKMIKLSKELYSEYLNSFKNQEIDVLWEKKDTNFLYGKSSQYFEVIKKIDPSININTFSKEIVKTVFLNYVLV